MYGTSTEVLSFGQILVLGSTKSVFDQLVDALIFRRRNGNDRNTQFLLQFQDIYRASVGTHFIHQISLNVGGIYNINNAVRFFLNEKITCHNFLSRVRAE